MKARNDEGVFKPSRIYDLRNLISLESDCSKSSLVGKASIVGRRFIIRYGVLERNFSKKHARGFARVLAARAGTGGQRAVGKCQVWLYLSIATLNRIIRDTI